MIVPPSLSKIEHGSTQNATLADVAASQGGKDLQWTRDRKQRATTRLEIRGTAARARGSEVEAVSWGACGEYNSISSFDAHPLASQVKGHIAIVFKTDRENVFTSGQASKSEQHKGLSSLLDRNRFLLISQRNARTAKLRLRVNPIGYLVRRR